MPASYYVQTNSLNMWLAKSPSVTLPSTVYVGLFLTNPTGAGSGTEVTGNGYSRMAATFGNPTQSGSTMVISNTNRIEFPQATGTWGTPQYFALYDSSSGGNLLFYDSLPTTFEIVSGMAPVFVTGNLTVSCQ